MVRTVYQLTCKQCGKQFTVPNAVKAAKQKYCGYPCYWEAVRKPDRDEIAGPYLTVPVPAGHPLVNPGLRKAFLHRLLLWEAIGPGPHPCYRCGEMLNWTTDNHQQPGSLCVDHADRNTRNNSLDNLRPSCHGCNMINSKFRVQDHEVFRTTNSGNRLRCEMRNCRHCGKLWPARLHPKPKGGQFCSMDCKIGYQRVHGRFQ